MKGHSYDAERYFFALNFVKQFGKSYIQIYQGFVLYATKTQSCKKWNNLSINNSYVICHVLNVSFYQFTFLGR